MPSVYLHAHTAKEKRDKSGFLISMLRSETMLINCINGEAKKNDDVEDDAAFL